MFKLKFTKFEWLMLGLIFLTVIGWALLQITLSIQWQDAGQHLASNQQKLSQLHRENDNLRLTKVELMSDPKLKVAAQKAGLANHPNNVMVLKK